MKMIESICPHDGRFVPPRLQREGCVFWIDCDNCDPSPHMHMHTPNKLLHTPMQECSDMKPKQLIFIFKIRSQPSGI